MYKLQSVVFSVSFFFSKGVYLFCLLLFYKVGNMHKGMKWLAKIIKCLGHDAKMKFQFYFFFSAQFFLHKYSYVSHFATGLLQTLLLSRSV